MKILLALSSILLILTIANSCGSGLCSLSGCNSCSKIISGIIEFTKIHDLSGANEYGYAIHAIASGKILIAGQIGAQFGLSRYNSDGSLDSSNFGESAGFTSTNIETGTDQNYSMVVYKNGKILTNGNAAGFFSNSAFIRYHPNGSRDTSFGTNGIRYDDVNGALNEDPRAMALTNPDSIDSKIIVGGITNTNVSDFFVTRYYSDGAIDTTFGTGGYVTTDFSAAADSLYSLLIQPDGKIVAGGSATTGGDLDCAMARYYPDGALDTTFGTGGLVQNDLSPGTADEIFKVLLLPDNKILASGRYVNNSMFVSKYLENGSLDTTFGTTGTFTTALLAGGNNMTLQSDGKIIIAGNDLTQDSIVMRLTSSGVLDTTFGTGGLIVSDTALTQETFLGLAWTTDCKLLASGMSRPGSRDVLLIKYH